MASGINEIPVFSLKRRRVEYGSVYDDGEEPTTSTRCLKVARPGPNYYSNVELVRLFGEERAFDEHTARLTLLNRPGGMHLGANALVKKTLIKKITHIARVIVFNETVSQRIQRCKNDQLKQNPTIDKPENIIEGWETLTSILQNNDIDVSTFAHVTFKHLTRQNGRKNNLLFYGPPSTGKTMIMESLVKLHYNFAFLAGMPTKKSFFATLLNHNACFFKGTLLQPKSRHEAQWLLLAAGRPLCTEEGTQLFVEKCVMYTCACAPMQGALAAHTTAFRFDKEVSQFTVFSVFVWLKLWSEFGLEI